MYLLGYAESWTHTRVTCLAAVSWMIDKSLPLLVIWLAFFGTSKLVQRWPSFPTIMAMSWVCLSHQIKITSSLELVMLLPSYGIYVPAGACKHSQVMNPISTPYITSPTDTLSEQVQTMHRAACSIFVQTENWCNTLTTTFFAVSLPLRSPSAGDICLQATMISTATCGTHSKERECSLCKVMTIVCHAWVCHLTAWPCALEVGIVCSKYGHNKQCTRRPNKQNPKKN